MEAVYPKPEAPETIQIAPELRRLLSEEWSQPVEVKVADGELIFRNV
jgi:hypothetical protein